MAQLLLIIIYIQGTHTRKRHVESKNFGLS